MATALARADEADREFTRLEGTIADEEGSEEGLDEVYERAAEAHDAAEAEVERIVEAGRVADRDRQSAQARPRRSSSACAERTASRPCARPPRTSTRSSARSPSWSR